MKILLSHLTASVILVAVAAPTPPASIPSAEGSQTIARRSPTPWLPAWCAGICGSQGHSHTKAARLKPPGRKATTEQKWKYIHDLNLYVDSSKDDAPSSFIDEVLRDKLSTMKLAAAQKYYEDTVKERVELIKQRKQQGTFSPSWTRAPPHW